MFDAVPRFGPTRDNKTTSCDISNVAAEAFCTSVNQRFVFFFFQSIRQLVEELGQYYVCSKWSAM